MNTNCIRSNCFESNYHNYGSDFHIWRGVVYISHPPILVSQSRQ